MNQPKIVGAPGKKTNAGLKLSSQNHEFAQVSCGAEHSFALTTTGELYSWGLNFKG
jgi:alpha-tubulin suppressor-like RCC1 family protein